MPDITKSSFVDTVYSSGDLFLNRTYLGPFYEFCKSADETLCFCNYAYRHNQLFFLEEERATFVLDYVYDVLIQEHDHAPPPGTCVDLDRLHVRYPIGMYIIPENSTESLSSALSVALNGMIQEARHLQATKPLEAGYLSTVEKERDEFS